jgi:hypothetical protein
MKLVNVPFLFKKVSVCAPQKMNSDVKKTETPTENIEMCFHKICQKNHKPRACLSSDGVG